MINDGRILLIEKKRGLGAGKINGPGGKVEPGESPEAAARREFEEELRAIPANVRKVGEVWFHVIEGGSLRIHIFRSDSCEPEPTETEEAAPFWYESDDVPFERMWSDDRYWFPYLLEQQPFLARTVFENDILVEWDVTPAAY